MPNGFAQAPLLFTKLLKQPFASLRKQGLLSVGFKVTFDKSVLLPAQRIKFLGFILDSVSMTISLPDKRQVRILALCKHL